MQNEILDRDYKYTQPYVDSLVGCRIKRSYEESWAGWSVVTPKIGRAPPPRESTSSQGKKTRSIKLQYGPGPIFQAQTDTRLRGYGKYI
jgi:hypothetical protein